MSRVVIKVYASVKVLSINGVYNDRTGTGSQCTSVFGGWEFPNIVIDSVK